MITFDPATVVLINPSHPTPFANFIELEKWLETRAPGTQRQISTAVLERGPEDLRSAELAIYFEPQPNDPVWKPVTFENVEQLQEAFIEIWRTTELDRYMRTNAVPKSVVDTICDIANKHSEAMNFNPAFVILLAHQYLDADVMLRALHRSRWVASMVKRADFAPSPESYVEYIKAQYGLGRK